MEVVAPPPTLPSSSSSPPSGSSWLTVLRGSPCFPASRHHSSAFLCVCGGRVALLLAHALHGSNNISASSRCRRRLLRFAATQSIRCCRRRFRPATASSIASAVDSAPTAAISDSCSWRQRLVPLLRANRRGWAGGRGCARLGVSRADSARHL
jgi:hypothetical protein